MMFLFLDLEKSNFVSPARVSERLISFQCRLTPCVLFKEDIKFKCTADIQETFIQIEKGFVRLI